MAKSSVVDHKSPKMKRTTMTNKNPGDDDDNNGDEAMATCTCSSPDRSRRATFESNREPWGPPQGFEQ